MVSVAAPRGSSRFPAERPGAEGTAEVVMPTGHGLRQHQPLLSLLLNFLFSNVNLGEITTPVTKKTAVWPPAGPADGLGNSQGWHSPRCRGSPLGSYTSVCTSCFSRGGRGSGGLGRVARSHRALLLWDGKPHGGLTARLCVGSESLDMIGRGLLPPSHFCDILSARVRRAERLRETRGQHAPRAQGELPEGVVAAGGWC